ncbi:MAG: alkaline phosphatase family protein [Acidimicrobiales bacterium]
MQKTFRQSRVKRACRLGAVATVLCTTAILSPVAASGAASISASSPCVGATATSYSHVVWIMMENEGYTVIGAPSAPYVNRLTNVCSLATQYYAVSHPSLPNYIALTSGSTQGIVDDGEPNQHVLTSASIFSQLGTNWRSLVESMPSRCDHVTSGVYAARHNPAVYYRPDGAACQRSDVPLTLPLDLSKKFTFVVPNVCDDMHSCPVPTGDQWLHRMVPAIIASPQYQSGSLVLFITFDENNLQSSNRVPTIVIAPSVPRGLRVGERFTHYSLLGTTESLLHLPLLGSARTAPLMIERFHL